MTNFFPVLIVWFLTCRQVAKRLQSFGMTTIGYDPFVSAEAAAEWDIEALELEEIWPRADYITVHTPLLPHTRNLLGEEVFTNKCKRGVKVRGNWP